MTRSEPANDRLLDDLRSDVGMEWVPEAMWLSYLQLDAPAGELDYDLAVSDTPWEQPAFDDTGVPEPEAVPVGAAGDGIARWPMYAGVVTGPLAAAAGLLVIRRRHTAIETTP